MVKPRPPHLLPRVPVLARGDDDPRRFENGYLYLEKMFKEQEAELERMRTMIYDLKRDSLDLGIGVR